MLQKSFQIRGLLCLFALSLLAGSEAATPEMVEYFTDNGYGNPIATIQHPCAEYFEGTTYIAYQGPHEDPYLCAYNHEAKTWSGPEKAGVSLMGRDVDATRTGSVDNHGRPAMVVDAKGYIHLIFGGHGGSSTFGSNEPGNAGKGKQTHVVSKRPRDITAWEELENISPFGTYSQWVKMDDGDLYLFFRHGSHQSDWVYQKSSDNGRNFAEPISVLKHKPGLKDPNEVDAWYAWFNNGKGDTITASYVFHPCNKSGPGRHTKDRYNGYYMNMNCVDDSWRNASGEALSIPITKEYAAEYTLVVNTDGGRANHGTCQVDEEGNPHLFFRHDDGHVRYYRWLGDAWQGPTRVVPGSKSQDGDMVVESPLNARLLLRHKDGGVSSVGWWDTSDGGLTWSQETPLITSKKVSYNPISAMVRNAHPGARIVVSEDAPGQNHQYRKLILLGDDGPVQRLKAEAANVGDLVNQVSKTTDTPRRRRK